MLQTVMIPAKGGLNLSATNQELLSLPNEALILDNMEASRAGGYRRIDGYEEYGTTTLPGGVEPVRGIHTYLGGILVIKGTSIYHSFGGFLWTKVNKISNGVTKAVLDAQPNNAELDNGVTRKVVNIKTFVEGTKTHVYMVTGNSAPIYLLINGTTEVSALYTYREVALGTELIGAKSIAIFQDQVILANTTEHPTSIIYSSLSTTDLTVAELAAGLTVREKYDGSTSGQISVSKTITGLAVHRNSLYVFTDTTISKVDGLNSGNPQVIPVTEDIGCIDGATIQEVGGDLVYLAADGLRTLSQTVRIGDVELGVISRKIAPITDALLIDRASITFSSCVIRKKNQYRLWYTSSNTPTDEQRGIIATYAYDSRTGGSNWEYSLMLGWEVNSIHSGEDSNGVEFSVFGNSTGKVYSFEKTFATFDGTAIPWKYQSPFVDFGDSGVRKNIHKALVNMIAEGLVSGELAIKYDYQSNHSPQPDPWNLVNQTPPAIMGVGLLGNPLLILGAGGFTNEAIYTEGSGFQASFIISDVGLSDDPFEIQSIQVNFAPSGRI